jgi:hypothetical protein
MPTTHDDDDAHVEPERGAPAFGIPLHTWDRSAPDIGARCAWNGTVSAQAAAYANARGECVPIDGTSLRRLAVDWRDAAEEIRRLREMLREQ